MKGVQKSAKIRAPRYTGSLANSIKVIKIKNGWVLSVDQPYAYEQETGEGLPRYVPISALRNTGWTREKSKTRGGLIKGGSKKAEKGFFVKRSYKPFITPAIESNINIFSQNLKKSINTAIK
jgi:hypothetical protein